MSGLTDLGANSAQQSQANDSDSDDDSEYENNYERYDLDGVFYGAQHPQTAVRGEPDALRKLYDENDPDRSDVAVILTDPSVVTDDEGLEGGVVVHGEDESDDFKVVDTNDEDTKILEGMGIDFDGNTFYGDIEDDFGDMSPIALKRGGGAGRSITATLDVKGAVPARRKRDEDGNLVLHGGGHPEHSGGLIEYDNAEDGEMPRYARDPQLRPDVQGGDVVIMIQRLAEIDPDYDGNAYWSTVFAETESAERRQELAEQYAEDDEDAEPEDFLTEVDGDEFVQLQPTDEFEPDEDLVDATGWLEWHIDYDDPEDIAELNEAREEAGFEPYEPDR